MKRHYCSDCGTHSAYHLHTWLEEIMGSLLPTLRLPRKIDAWFDVGLEKVCSGVGLIQMRDDFSLSEIQMRSACFVEAARKRGVTFHAAKGPAGYTGHFCAGMNGRSIRFARLPTAEHAGMRPASFTDCKVRTKDLLKKGGFPVADGASFWFWQKRHALKFGSDELGFPLVVKPRGGSVSRHVTTNIRNENELLKAIDRAIVYSPVFIVERFIEHSFVYRATVVDFDFVAVVGQEPANVVGDGGSTIRELIEKKNRDNKRGTAHQKGFTLHKLIVDATTEKLLAEKNYTLETVLKKDEKVYLQKNPFLRLGGDLVEVTGIVHPDTMQLFKDIARFFDIRLVGIDFLVPDVSDSWQRQQCAVVELNSVPCIEMHHFPSSGNPQNVADALVNLFFKYYL